MTPTPWDVAVVGGGPAGAMAALVLARAGRRVLLADGQSPSPSPGILGGEPCTGGARKIGESLPAIAGHLLRKLGLGALLEHGHRSAFGNVSAWGSGELVATDFVNDPHGLGWHLDRARFDRELRDAAVAAGATLRPLRARAKREASGWTLRFADGSLEPVACVIDATGRRATIARGEGAVRTRDDDLVALYAWATRDTAEPAPPEAGPRRAVDERTQVEAVPDGWWYTAPLPDDGRVLVLHVAAATARRIRQSNIGLARWLAPTGSSGPIGPGGDLDISTRARQLTRRRGPRRTERGGSAEVDVASRTGQGNAGADEPLAGWDFGASVRVAEACGSRLDAFVGRGWVAVGDAALAFDPIAAQGIFNALYSGMRAGEAVDAALRGEPGGLAAYSRRLEEIRATYVERHRYVYGLEQRFRDRPFWRAR